jgi:hypothetical protein
MEAENTMKEDWPILLSFFPDNWVELASASDALKGLRKDKDVENYMRTLLIHIACGYSMRETATRAKLAGLADISDVAMIGRLRKAKDWLHSMCVELFEEQGVSLHKESEFQVRLFDATNVKEPGKTGSLWRIHYSVQLPSLTCDFFKLTATEGKGTGESFFQYTIKKGDYIIADRGYSTASLLDNVKAIEKAGTVRAWKVLIPSRSGATVQGRICVIRKSNEAITMAQEKLNKNAQKKGHSIKPETLEYAKYVIVFTNYPEDSFSSFQVLDWYRARWQVELIFKRFKSIAQLGHLPKHSDDSSKAWLYGKLFVALLTNKLIEYASSISPWGYILEEHATSECLA